MSRDVAAAVTVVAVLVVVVGVEECVVVGEVFIVPSIFAQCAACSIVGESIY